MLSSLSISYIDSQNPQNNINDGNGGWNIYCLKIEQICFLDEFTSMKEDIAPWLESSPSLDKLNDTRKKLKSLKSKLRHTLADKADAEEVSFTDEMIGVLCIFSWLTDFILEIFQYFASTFVMEKKHAGIG